jgi:hypothetical protein
MVCYKRYALFNEFFDVFEVAALFCHAEGYGMP